MICHKNNEFVAMRFSPVRQAGASLVELMVAMAMGLLIVAAMIALFVNINRSNSELAKVNSQIENGRFAIQLLTNDVVHAGFWGTYQTQFDDLSLYVYSANDPTTPSTIPNDTPNLIPEAFATYNPTNWTSGYKSSLIGIPLQAYDADPGCGATGGCTTDVVTHKQGNTDVLVVRHANTCVPGTTNCEADTAGKLYFQSTLCPTDTTHYVLDTSGFTLHQGDCATAANKRKFISNIYYIRDYAVTQGDGIPTLMRSQFDLSSGSLSHQSAQPLIQGIQGFRVELGIDTTSKDGTDITSSYGTVPSPQVGCTNATDPRYKCSINWVDPSNRTSANNRGDGTPDSFVHCSTATPCTLAQLTNAVAVRLYILARNLKPTVGYTDSKTYALGSSTLGPFNDNYQRHVYSTTVVLNSVAARRVTP
jgi:type IV pilus assembly protein PilW